MRMKTVENEAVANDICLGYSGILRSTVAHKSNLHPEVSQEALISHRLSPQEVNLRRSSDIQGRSVNFNENLPVLICCRCRESPW